MPQAIPGDVQLMNKNKPSSGDQVAPTLRDIAQRSGLSKTTVSRVLSGNFSENNQATIDHVLDVARSMGYDSSRHHAARRLAMSKYGQTVLSRVLGLLFSANLGPTRYFSRVYKGISQVALEEHYGILTDHHYTGWRGTLPEAYRRGDVDGIVVLEQAAWINEACLKLRSDLGFGNRPIVGLIDPIHGCSAVYADNFNASHSAASHLLDLGHRNVFSFVSPDGFYTSVQRASGFRAAFVDRGLDPEKHLIHYVPERPNASPLQQEDFTKDRLRRTLALHPNVTAIWCPNDLIAVQVWRALRQMALRVPEDLSLVGFDDTDEVWDIDGNNILTTVRLPLEEIGRQGAELAIRRIMREETEDRDIILPSSLIVRGSTGPPRRHPLG